MGLVIPMPLMSQPGGKYAIGYMVKKLVKRLRFLVETEMEENKDLLKIASVCPRSASQTFFELSDHEMIQIR